MALVRRSLRWTELLYRAPAAALLIALLFVAAAAPSYAADDTLEIVSKTGVHVFAVELAVTDEQRAKGLMFRRSLPEGQGMLLRLGDRMSHLAREILAMKEEDLGNFCLGLALHSSRHETQYSRLFRS